MGRVKKTGSEKVEKRIRPALTPEARENQLISLAVDLAEKQLLEGTAGNLLYIGIQCHALDDGVPAQGHDALRDGRG